MKKENKENLVKLAKFVLSEVSDEQFDMSFCRGDKGLKKIFKSITDCGTVGCALGWAPFVKGLEAVEGDFIESETHDSKRLSFYYYKERVFGNSYFINISWGFIFGCGWSEIDNTREGFVKRVVYFLKGGKNFELTTNNYKHINPNKIYEYEQR